MNLLSIILQLTYQVDFSLLAVIVNLIINLGGIVGLYIKIIERLTKLETKILMQDKICLLHNKIDEVKNGNS